MRWSPSWRHVFLENAFALRTCVAAAGLSHDFRVGVALRAVSYNADAMSQFVRPRLRCPILMLTQIPFEAGSRLFRPSPHVRQRGLGDEFALV